jgi:uncharacterized radical SAM superfamily Fe-S cluster-containing enzyme
MNNIDKSQQIKTSYMTLINTIKAYCRECSQLHEADIRQKENEIWVILKCPGGDKHFFLSSDADFFLMTLPVPFMPIRCTGTDKRK